MDSMTHTQSVLATEVRPGDLLMPERREVVSVEIDPDPRVVVLKFVTKSAPVYAGKALDPGGLPMTTAEAMKDARSTREEALARLEKAHAIITVLETLYPDLDLDVVRNLDQAGRDAAASLGGRRTPSEKTWAIVVRHYEAKTSDPFEGLPQ